MRTALTILFVITLYCTFGSAQLPSSQVLRCRQCVGASTLSDCKHMVTCDNTLEACYMDEIVTDQLTVEYNGGCRSKQVCSSSLHGRKRSDLCCCSRYHTLEPARWSRHVRCTRHRIFCDLSFRCCSFADDCNKRLCGIRDDTLNSTQCYSCDHRTSEQSEVKDPSQCVTLETCQSNEVCYTTQSDVAGTATFYYGCLSKLQCTYLMERAFNDYKVCVLKVTAPPNGLTYQEACANVGTRSTSLCHSCCGDSGCNYGTCREVNERIFKLAMDGRFDFKTLKVI